MAYQPEVGMSIEALDTPSLILELDAFEQNIARMAAFLKGKSVKLRPHCKTHKCVEVAKRQLAAGAIGITCAKVSEAEVFAAQGIENILIANQITGATKIDRVTELAAKCDLKIAVDSLENIIDLQKAAQHKSVKLGILVEIEIGMSRCGVPAGAPVLKLAEAIIDAPNLIFKGLQAYEGHLVMLPDPEERKTKVEETMKKVLDTYNLLHANGIPVDMVSGGGTGTFDITSDCEPFNEIQAGSYVFMDSTYKQFQPVFENALFILSSVVSRPAPERLITDIGLKSASKEFGWPVLLEVEDAEFFYLSEEHGVMTLGQPEKVDLKAGQKVRYLPSHCCTTVNLYDQLYVVQGNKVVDIWRIDARGCSQ
jgi:D-serine deaminase-like pyridoxal phosphate-dependent protein